jgi:Ca2+-binding RTX toxin-like protein
MFSRRRRAGRRCLVESLEPRLALSGAPLAIADVFQARYETGVTVEASGVLANDVDPDGDLLSAIQASAPANGQLTWNGDGSFAYTPNAGFFGSDSFTYRASDGTAASDVATVTIQVLPAIHVGHHALAPNTAGQVIPIYVSGGVPVQGMNFNLQVGDGGPAAGGSANGPAIQGLDILTGTIFAANNNGTTDIDGDQTPDLAPLFEGRDTTTGSGFVVAEGLLGTVTVDTTGFNEGQWPLMMSRTVNGTSDFTVIPAMITDGTLSIDDPSANDAPTISPIADQSTSEDVAKGPIHFTVGDAETPAESLVVSATSDNQDLLRDGDISLSGSGASRAIALRPAANRYGSATITVVVSDGSASTSQSFQLDVHAENDPPVLGAIEDQVTTEGVTASAIPFLFGDLETEPGSLVITASSSNQLLVPDANIVFSGVSAAPLQFPAVPLTGTTSLAVTPASNQSGTVTITITVSDGTDTTEESFALTVTPRDNPLIVKGTKGADRINVLWYATEEEVGIRVNGRDRGRTPLTSVTEVVVFAYGGNDRIVVAADLPLPVKAYGGYGNDYIAGGAGNDLLIGGPGSDTILGLAGNDRLEGGGGNDRLYAGEGDDLLIGHAGADYLQGAAGNDLLYGGWGNDTLLGSDGNDYLDGGAHHDKLYGGTGNDALTGGGGSDRLTGGLDDDFLIGGPGGDRFFGQYGRNLLLGYLRDDTFTQGPADLRVTGLAASDPQLAAANALFAAWVANADPWADAEALFASPAPAALPLAAPLPEAAPLPQSAPLPQAAPVALPSTSIEPSLDGALYDVNGDGRVTPQDVLFVVNALNSANSTTQTDAAETGDATGAAVDRLAGDINQDGQLTPLDALLVVNRVEDDLLLLLAADGRSAG